MAQFRLSEVDVRWSGTDDTTPPGHCIATGLDMFDNLRVWLFEGREPSDAGYKGNLLLPRPEGSPIVSAYGARGAYVRSGHDQTELLKFLAERG
jgi:hypothetical protein